MISLFGKPEPTLLEKLKQSVTKTRTELAAKVEEILTGDRPVDPELLKELESALLSADLGVRTTKEVLAALREQVNQHKLEGSSHLKRSDTASAVRRGSKWDREDDYHRQARKPADERGH
jgi:fused signal recognition particle receptor